ncbi:MAG: hypothetical protein M1834_001077 [Cirrosporium novae-zelandiae]|nr:MAG: hypothetical protein M1834_001077 [Cirrosporium novae-zelandiae]
MATFNSPFAKYIPQPGNGTLHLALLSPSVLTLSKFSYSYPLKLIAPSSHTSPSNHQVATVFLLSYGGGLLPNDHIYLTVHQERETRLAILTQGSTKIFPQQKEKEGAVQGKPGSSQFLDVTIDDNAALCYLPDPVQPFGTSIYEQKQMFRVREGSSSSLCVLDWVSEGRRARGESWKFYRWAGRNEVWMSSTSGSDEIANPGERLLLRDNVILDASSTLGFLADRMENMGVIGTLTIYGPLFQSLGEYFLDEFKKLPRIGARNWSTHDSEAAPQISQEEQIRITRQSQEKEAGVIWTAARVRSCVLVKFGAREVEGGRKWLGAMLKAEGSVEREFGERALLCLR